MSLRLVYLILVRICAWLVPVFKKLLGDTATRNDPHVVVSSVANAASKIALATFGLAGATGSNL